MPTYEYECEKCGHHFEEFQNITEGPLTKCPEKKCDGKVHRIISSGGGFLFKGSGFYTTDYRSDSYKKSAEAEKPKSSDDKKTDTKKPAEPKSAENKSTSSKKD